MLLSVISKPYMFCRRFEATDLRTTLASLLAAASQVMCSRVIMWFASGLEADWQKLNCCAVAICLQYVATPVITVIALRQPFMQILQGLPSVSGFCLGFGLGLRF